MDDQLAELRAENERLRAELSAKQKFVDDAFAACNDAGLLRRDAERYRWLRDHGWIDEVLGVHIDYSDSGMDAGIDEVMYQEEQKDD